MRRTSILLLLLGLAALWPKGASAGAGDAAETVRALYTPTVWNPLAEDDFSAMTGPARDLFEKSAAVSAETGEAGCIDFVVTVGGQDYDEEEIARTIRTEETGRTAEGDARVTARFTSFGTAEEMIWTMRETNGAWKIADLESPKDGWALSTFPCP